MNALRIAWIVAAICIVARVMVYPIDGIMWHLLGENFYLPRVWKGYSNAVFLLSLSSAIALSFAHWIEARKNRKS